MRSIALMLALVFGLSAPASAQLFGGPGGKDQTQIKHIVVIEQENRSVDDLFQKMPGVNTQSYGFNSHGAVIPLHARVLASTPDPVHRHAAFVSDAGFDGVQFHNNGFDLGGVDNCTGSCNPATFPYSYVSQSNVTQYYGFAENYAFADMMFQMNQGPSLPDHLYLVGGQSTVFPGGTTWFASNPVGGVGASGCENTGVNAATGNTIIAALPYPGTSGADVSPICTNFPTILSEADTAGVSWKFYCPSLNPTDGTSLWCSPYVINSLYLTDAANIVAPETTILTDVDNHTLPAISYVIPIPDNSDHPTVSGNDFGPDWVSEVVDKIGESSYWANTTIIVNWDDWGGWYDHVSPEFPVGIPLDPMENGFRVPMIVISPFVKPGTIDHRPREQGSILAYIEFTFGLPSLGKMDSYPYTDNLYTMFDFTQTPNLFIPESFTPPPAPPAGPHLTDWDNDG